MSADIFWSRDEVILERTRERDEARRLPGETLAEGITLKEELEEARAIARRLASDTATSDDYDAMASWAKE